MNETHHRIIIIGAGIAGLSAAEHLFCSGIEDVLILEASDRYGGRIQTAEFGDTGKQIELGANWIHGSTVDNCIFALAKTNNLLPDELIYVERHLGTFVTSSGETVNKFTSLRLHAAFVEILEGTKDLVPRCPETIEEYISSKAKDLSATVTTQEERLLINCFANYFRNYTAFHGGDDTYNMSAWGYGSFEDLPGGDVKIPSGFCSVLKLIVNKVPPESIVLNCKVDEINYRGDKVIITCHNGQRFSADHVIVTVSLGVLKATHTRLFVPHLPEDKIEAIERMGFGRVTKIFMYYKHPFWKPGELKHINFVWNDEEYERKEVAQDGWIYGMNGIEEVLNNPNVLMSWVGGNIAEVIESFHKQRLAEDCAKVIRRFLKNDSIPVPDNVCCSCWCTDKRFLGTYSYPSCSSEVGDHDRLASPLPSLDKPKLLFSGEATQEKFFSTVHGARISGIREAKRILDWIQ